MDLTIEAGASTAAVGVNGAGKTTLIKLLCGLHEPTEGRILVDGVDIRDTGVGAWQRNCATLFQDWLRWNLPVRDNIVFGAPEGVQDAAALQEVVAAVGVAELSGSMPQGWSTVPGREFGGTDVSGGQWQRVGLAGAVGTQGGGELPGPGRADLRAGRAGRNRVLRHPAESGV